MSIAEKSMSGGPTSPAAPVCMCAANTGRSMFSAVAIQVMVEASVSMVNVANPVPSGSAGGTSLAPLRSACRVMIVACAGSENSKPARTVAKSCRPCMAPPFAQGDAGSTPGRMRCIPRATTLTRRRNNCLRHSAACGPASYVKFVDTSVSGRPVAAGPDPAASPLGAGCIIAPHGSKGAQGVRMLTRDQLTDDQWRTVRNTPHHVAIAVSSVGGSIFDEMLERAAAMSGIVDALNSRHPLVQGIGSSADIMAAQDQLRAWYHSLDDSERQAANLQAKALDMFKDAVDTLQQRGQHDDVRLYCDFVIALATRVARTAREGDMLGIGGELVSSGERSFIALLEAAATNNGR